MGPMLAAGLVTAGGNLIGNLLGMSSARTQMKFQERMRNTAYQAAVKDMRLAGINPMLAYMQGGAQSPGGAMYQPTDMLGPAVSSAMQAKRLEAEYRNLDKVSDKLDVERRILEWTAGYPAGLGNQHMYFSDNVLNAQLRRAKAEADSVEFQNKEREAMARFWDRAGEAGAWAKFGIPLLKLIFGR